VIKPPAFALVALLALLGSSGESLPSVAQVQARFVRALGGSTAITQPHSMTIHGQNVLYGAHGKRTVVNYVAYLADFKRLEIDTVQGKGKYLSGYDGATAWAMSPDSKPQIFAGSVGQSTRRDADMYYFAHIPKYFTSMSVAGVETFGGQPCYHLRGTTLWGNENNQYYSVASGLLVGYRFHQWMGNGPEKAQSIQIFDQYRSFNGLMISMRERDYRDGVFLGVGRVTSVQFDDVDSRVFILPAPVRALVRAG
jgi:hypothetical protein